MYYAVNFDQFVLQALEDAFPNDWCEYAVLFVMVTHIWVFTFIMITAKMALALVAAPNCRSHFLFPLQFFDLMCAQEPQCPLCVSRVLPLPAVHISLVI